MKTNDYKEKLKLVKAKLIEIGPDLTYHNLNHVLRVYNVGSKLADLERIGSHDKFLLQTGILLHDIVYISRRNDNEEKSVEFARNYLLSVGYSQEDIETISGMIIATKLPPSPKNLLEYIICDADLDNLGNNDFFEENKKFMQELGRDVDEAWYLESLRFLLEHKYYTNSAKTLRNPRKTANIQKLKEMIEQESLQETKC